VLSTTNLKATRLSEDFHYVLAKGGGVDHDPLRLGLPEVTAPRADEDFVAYLACFLGINDKQIVSKWRHMLTSEEPGSKTPELGFSEVSTSTPGDQVGHNQQPSRCCRASVWENEDAASFFLRIGSWVCL
jgi:hypothetical protein